MVSCLEGEGAGFIFSPVNVLGSVVVRSLWKQGAARSTTALLGMQPSRIGCPRIGIRR
jgi:hypothetical protein